MRFALHIYQLLPLLFWATGLCHCVRNLPKTHPPPKEIPRRKPPDIPYALMGACFGEGLSKVFSTGGINFLIKMNYLQNRCLQNGVFVVKYRLEMRAWPLWRLSLTVNEE